MSLEKGKWYSYDIIDGEEAETMIDGLEQNAEARNMKMGSTFLSECLESNLAIADFYKERFVLPEVAHQTLAYLMMKHNARLEKESYLVLLDAIESDRWSDESEERLDRIVTFRDSFKEYYENQKHTA